MRTRSRSLFTPTLASSHSKTSASAKTTSRRWTSDRTRATPSSSTNASGSIASAARSNPSATTSLAQQTFTIGNFASRTAAAWSVFASRKANRSWSLCSRVFPRVTSPSSVEGKMNRGFLKFAVALIGTLMIIVPLANLDGLPRDLRRQIDSERTALETAKSDLATTKSEVSRKLDSERDLFRGIPASVQWPAQLDRAAVDLGLAAADMNQLTALEKQNRRG